MEPEFLDPGPGQPPPGGLPWMPAGAGDPRAPALPGPTRAGRRESAGLLVMLLAATALPALAAQQTLYSVTEQDQEGAWSFAVGAWGDYHSTTGPPLLGNAPRFGFPLSLAAIGFGLLALVVTVQLLGGRSRRPDRVAFGVALTATGLGGALAGVTIAMVLQVQSAFAQYRAGLGVIELHLQVGATVWLAAAGVLAAGLSVTAGLRVRRALGGLPSGY